MQKEDGGREQVEVKLAENGSSGVLRARTGSLSVSGASREHVSEDRNGEREGEEGDFFLDDLIVVACYWCRENMLRNVQLTYSVCLVHMLICVCTDSPRIAGRVARWPQCCRCVSGYQ